MTGVVKRKVADKGYMFISRDDKAGADVFCHLSALANIEWEDVEEGMHVEFETEEGKKGLQVRSKPRSLRVLG